MPSRTVGGGGKPPKKDGCALTALALLASAGGVVTGLVVLAERALS